MTFHLIIYQSFALTSNLEKSSFQHLIRDFEHADWQLFRSIIRRELSTRSIIMTRRSEIDQAIQFLSDSILIAFNQSVPLKQVHFNSINLTNIKPLISQRNAVRRRIQRSRSNLERIYLESIKKVLQSRIDYAINSLRNEKFSNSLQHINACDDNPNKKLFRICKFFKNGKQKLPFLKQGNLRLITDNEKCETLANHFQSVRRSNFRETATSHRVRRSIELLNRSSFDNSEIDLISMDSVRSITQSLNSLKAPGPDNIFNICLKNLPTEGLAMLTSIFNTCLIYSYFPKAWKQANVCAVLKPGKPPNNTTSYRPISLLSVLGKLFEKLLLPLFQAHLEDNQILPSFQFGFRKSRSTVHQLVRVTESIKTNINTKKSVGLLSLDLQAAFDTVWHNGLLYKMLANNFPIYLIKLIQSYLESRTFNVKIGDSLSTLRTIETGVPQGSVLSPTLFNILVSDLPSCDNIDIAQFADDTLMSTSSHQTSTIVNRLSKSGSVMARYFERWHIQINSLKSETCFFSRKTAIRHQPMSNIRVLDEDINWKESIKYLGLHLDKRLTYQTHIDQTIMKCERLIRMLYPLMSRNSYLRIQNKILIHKLYFRPIFCYASPIWVNCANVHFLKLQRLQNKILKMILTFIGVPVLHSFTELVILICSDLILQS